MTTGLGSLVPKGKMEVMGPPAPRARKHKREQIVLDEDEWIDKIEAIIQRDYFPDLPKLESEVEWIEAVRTKDPVLIRQAQANIAKRRAGLKTPVGHTPATFATPAVNSTPSIGSTPVGEARQQQDEQAEQQEAAAPSMSLDRFMASHTSEDNASFDEILEGINKRRRLKHAWLHSDGGKEEAKRLEDKRPLDGYGTTGQTSGALLNWPYVPDNTLFYRRDAVPFTDKELALQVQGPPKQISAANTRMPTTSDEVDLTAAKKPERGDEYERVATPSFTPGPEAPPPMTWGRLDATPARVEDDNAGPHFRVLERKPKDILAHRLADGARLNLQKRAALMSPSVLHGIGRKTPRMRSRLLGTPQLKAAGKVKMSPAAHRLATSLRGSKGGSGDAALRASYRAGSSVRQPAGGPTPAASHPSETPAIFRGETPVRAPALKPAVSAEEDAIRAAALQASNPSAARDHALKAFEPTAARQDALKAFGKITDDLLHI